jgi:hypothetical protein
MPALKPNAEKHHHISAQFVHGVVLEAFGRIETPLIDTTEKPTDCLAVTDCHALAPMLPFPGTPDDDEENQFAIRFVLNLEAVTVLTQCNTRRLMCTFQVQRRARWHSLESPETPVGYV